MKSQESSSSESQWQQYLKRFSEEATSIYQISEDNDDLIAVAVFNNLPESGYSMGFSFGLSSVNYPEWIASRPELMITMRTLDHSWSLCMGEIIRLQRGRQAFSWGTVLRFRDTISEESKMTSLLVFTPTWIDRDEARFSKGNSMIEYSQLYPIYSEEEPLIRTLGVERFFWELGVDFDNPTRAPCSAPANVSE